MAVQSVAPLAEGPAFNQRRFPLGDLTLEQLVE